LEKYKPLFSPTGVSRKQNQDQGSWNFSIVLLVKSSFETMGQI